MKEKASGKDDGFFGQTKAQGQAEKPAKGRGLVDPRKGTLLHRKKSPYFAKNPDK